jgi:hypothetical protein
MFPVTMFLATIAYLPDTASPTVVGRWAVIAIGASACLFMVRRPMLGWGHLWALLLFMYGVASVTWSASPWDTMGELLHWLWLFALFVVASNYNKPENVLIAICLGLAVNVFFVMFELQGNELVVSIAHPAGLFLNRNALGEISATCLVWAIAYALSRGGELWALVPVPLLLTLASGSRGALLAAGVGFIWLLRGWWSRFAVLLATTACIVIWTVVKNPALASITIRFDIWQVMLTNLTWLGHGLETFSVLSSQEFGHNDPLQFVFELGIGACFAGAILAQSVRCHTPETAALVALTAASFVSYPSQHPMGAALMAILSGFAVGAGCRAERAERISGSVAAIRAEYEKSSSPTGLRQLDLSRRTMAV